MRDARGERPATAVGAADFWYEPEVWSLPLSPAAKVLYAGLCAFLGPGEINRKDLRGALKGSSDTEINAAFEDLARHGLLVPVEPGGLESYEVRSVREFAT